MNKLADFLIRMGEEMYHGQHEKLTIMFGAYETSTNKKVEGISGRTTGK